MESTSVVKRVNQKKKNSSPHVAISWNFPLILVKAGPCESISLSSPHLATFSSDMYVAFREGDDSIWIGKSGNGIDWNQGSYKILKSSANEMGVFRIFGAPTLDAIYTLYRPSIAEFSSYLYLAYTNKADNTIGLARTADPTPPLQKASDTWTPQSNVSVPTTPSSGPSIAVFNGRLFLAYRDTSGNIYVGSMGSSWASFQQVVDSNNIAVYSQDGPTLLAVTSGTLTYRLWISFRAVNTVYFGYANFAKNGYTLTGWTFSTISPQCNAMGMPVVALRGNDLYVAFQGSDQQICFGCSTNGGTSWGDWGTLGNNLAIGAPSMVQKGSVLAMTFQAFSLETKRRYLMTTYYDFASEEN